MTKKIKILLVLTILLLNSIVSMFNNTYAENLTPTDDQKIEYRATKIQKVNNINQLTVEVWIHNLTFKGFDLRTSYDTDQLTPSTLDTNTAIDLTTEYKQFPSNFKFVNGFEEFMDNMNMSSSIGELRFVYSILGDDELTGTNEYIVQESGNTYIKIEGDKQIGEMTFQLDGLEVTEDASSILSGALSPITGVKLNIDGPNDYEDPNLYIFTVVAQTGTLKGSVDTTAVTEFTTGKHQANVRVFKEEDVENLLQTWQGWTWVDLINNFQIYETDDFHEEIDNNLTEVELVPTNDDGTFEISLAPGKYMVILDKPGYLDIMYYNIEIKSMGTVDLGKNELTPGDINKDGQVQIRDKGLMTENYLGPTGPGLNENYDFNNDGSININDKAFVTEKYGESRKMIDMTGKTTP